MHCRIPSILLLSLMASVCWGQNRAAVPDQRAAPPALTTVAEIRTQPSPAFNVDVPLSLTGIVTLVDASRKMVVLQDETGAIALHLDSPDVSVLPGQRVSLKASACAPYVINRPDYPYHPSDRDVQTSFEAPVENTEFRLTRMRGWLRPPTTGQYNFWIASDNSSELWLSTNANPAEARRIASVPANKETNPRQWARFPSQRSENLHLSAGEAYYIEALQEQQTGGSHLAVAWEGQGLKLAVIDGRYLAPWSAAGGSPTGPDIQADRGIQRECWANYSISNLAPVTGGGSTEWGLTIRGVEVSVLTDGVWPEPRPIEPGQHLEPDDVFRWVQGEGAVSFLASDGVSATLEIAGGSNRTVVRVARWQGRLPALSSRLRARFRGVCEGGRDLHYQLIAGVIWAPSEQDVSFFEGAAGQTPASAAAPPLAPEESAMGGYYYTRGVVMFNDRVRDRECLFVRDAPGGIFISQKERPIDPALRVGQFVEIGGYLLPRKNAPGMLPVMLNILGWQSLPVPAIPPTEAPVASYRDGQWTEMEGVARSVNANGTMFLMGKQVPFDIWISQTVRSNLEELINARLRVRGVMSLDLFDAPTLLVPSRAFVEIVEPAPKAAAPSVPVASLQSAGSGTGWTHQVKVTGDVTYRSERYFYLQDESGGTYVQPREAPPLQIGSAVEVVGFPGKEGAAVCLTEATWRPVSTGPTVAPSLNLQAVALARDGMLARIEARLLSQQTRGADQRLRLQVGQDVFEAVIEGQKEKLPEFADGSLLAVTGICILEPQLGGESIQGAADSPSAVLARLLLRTPHDVTLLQGPPWWTWQRTALLIGVLLTVLTVSVLRIEYLKRTHARQQAARLEFARAMIDSMENERRRIAASLHDSLGQNLLVIKGQAHLARQSASDKTALDQRLEEISTTTLQAIEDVREITRHLRPYQLDRLGLSHAIRAITRKVSESCSVVVASHVDEIDGIFDNESEIHIYRIVQEGMNNIVKHSGATEATVVVKKATRNLSISVRDNGCGLATAKGSPGGGFGLSGIRERAQILGGIARIDSSPGHGVSLQVELPLPPDLVCDPE